MQVKSRFLLGERAETNNRKSTVLAVCYRISWNGSILTFVFAEFVFVFVSSNGISEALLDVMFEKWLSS